MQAIRELLGQITAYAKLEMALVDKIEDLEKRVYALEQDMKLARASNRSNATRISELTAAFGALKRGE